MALIINCVEFCMSLSRTRIELLSLLSKRAWSGGGLLALLLSGSASAQVQLASEAPPVGGGSLALGYELMVATSLFATPDTIPTSEIAEFSRLNHVANIQLEYGLSRRSTVALEFPILYPLLQNDARSEPLHNALPMPGDALVSLRRKVTERSRSPLFGLRTELLLRLPTGHINPGATGSTLLTGSGLAELGAGLLWHKKVAAPVSVGIELRAIQALPGVVPYVTSTEPGLLGAILPGARFEGRAGLRLKPSASVGLELGGAATQRLSTYTGIRQADGTFVAAETPLAGTAGTSVRVGGALSLQPATWPMSVRLELEKAVLGHSNPELAVLGLDRFGPLNDVTGALRAAFRF